MMGKNDLLELFNNAEAVGVFCDTPNIHINKTVFYLHGKKTKSAEVKAIDLFLALGKSREDFDEIFSHVIYTKYPLQGYLNTNPTFYLGLSRELNKVVYVSVDSGQGPVGIFIVHGVNEDSTKAPYIEYLHPLPR